MSNEKPKCPLGHGDLKTLETKNSVVFRDVEIDYHDTYYVCEKCDIQVATPKQAGKVQKLIADKYRKKVGLLTSLEIKNYRKKYHLTQSALASEMAIGIASIKRWENGEIQSASMDSALKNIFTNKQRKDNPSGGRDLSIPRIKLVLITFEKLIGKKLLVKGDKFLYAAKYAWYADMISYRELGKGMTGASYAALPYGPQLNNYRDLIDEIKKSDITTVDPLTKSEIKIMKKIANKFPKQEMVFDASHKEPVWKETKIGNIIPYTKADLVKEL